MSSAGDATISALRGDLALQIARIVARGGTTQCAAARRLRIPQPTLSKIVNGRVADISVEMLIRVAVSAGLPISLHTGRVPEEAGAFVSSTRDPAPQSPSSTVAAAARQSLLAAERRLTPSQRLEAFLEHNQLAAALYRSAREAERLRVQRDRALR